MITTDIKVQISLTSGEKAEGWLFKEAPDGFYVALDLDRTNIRFIPRNLWTGTQFIFEPNDSTATADNNVDSSNNPIGELSKKLQEPMTEALSRVDYNRIRRITQDIHRSTNELSQSSSSQNKYTKGDDKDLLEFLLLGKKAHEDLIDEIQSSGLQQVIVEHQNELRRVVSLATLPQIDEQYVSRERLEEMIKVAKEDTLFYEEDDNGLSPKLPFFIVIDPTIKKSETKENKGGWGKLISGCVDFVFSSGLAATNIGLGVLSGVITTVPTLGASTIPIGLGIATSTYTGISNANRAIRELTSNERKNKG